MRKKILLAPTIALLVILSSFVQVSAQTTSTQTLESEEALSLEKIMDNIQSLASESQTSDEFTEQLQVLCLNTEYKNCTLIQTFISKLFDFLLRERGSISDGAHLSDLFEKIYSKFNTDYFVISYGSYKRLNPLKQNTIDFFRSGLSIWRYSDASAFITGRTIILQRNPFELHQKISGPQIGFMLGFKGLYLDMESKLTDNSYVFFIGHVDRILAFDLTPRIQ